MCCKISPTYSAYPFTEYKGFGDLENILVGASCLKKSSTSLEEQLKTFFSRAEWTKSIGDAPTVLHLLCRTEECQSLLIALRQIPYNEALLSTSLEVLVLDDGVDMHVNVLQQLKANIELANPVLQAKVHWLKTHVDDIGAQTSLTHYFQDIVGKDSLDLIDKVMTLEVSETIKLVCQYRFLTVNVSGQSRIPFVPAVLTACGVLPALNIPAMLTQAPYLVLSDTNREGQIGQLRALVDVLRSENTALLLDAPDGQRKCKLWFLLSHVGANALLMPVSSYESLVLPSMLETQATNQATGADFRHQMLLLPRLTGLRTLDEICILRAVLNHDRRQQRRSSAEGSMNDIYDLPDSDSEETVRPNVSLASVDGQSGKTNRTVKRSNLIVVHQP
eukprot:Clim_evm34s149 gene=Clim_evmTU34s149